MSPIGRLSACASGGAAVTLSPTTTASNAAPVTSLPTVECRIVVSSFWRRPSGMHPRDVRQAEAKARAQIVPSRQRQSATSVIGTATSWFVIGGHPEAYVDPDDGGVGDVVCAQSSVVESPMFGTLRIVR